MRLVGVLAEGQDRGVLEEEQLVADPAVGAGRGKTFLELPRLPVWNTAKPSNTERRVRRGVCRERGVDRGAVHRATIAGGPFRIASASDVAAAVVDRRALDAVEAPPSQGRPTPSARGLRALGVPVDVLAELVGPFLHLEDRLAELRHVRA